ncbi:hypothetical protein PFISCL1PPCAC_22725, partial [Pristionchus fissidentatus]
HFARVPFISFEMANFANFDDVKQQAIAFSASDKLGSVVAKVADLLKCLASPQIQTKEVKYLLDSIEMEKTLALRYDDEK